MLLGELLRKEALAAEGFARERDLGQRGAHLVRVRVGVRVRVRVRIRVRVRVRVRASLAREGPTTGGGFGGGGGVVTSIRSSTMRPTSAQPPWLG